MAIKGNLSTGVQDLAATDTDISLHDLSNRSAIMGFSLFNITSGDITVNIFESPDGTSAAGTWVATYVLPGTSSTDVIECIGQGYAATINLVARIPTAAVNAGDVNAKLTYTIYTGDS